MINAGLRGLGIELSDEALRLWFKPKVRGAKNRKDQGQPSAIVASAPAVAPTEPAKAIEPVLPTGLAMEAVPPGPNLPPPKPMALPGELFAERLARWRATRPPLLSQPKGPTIARDDL